MFGIILLRAALFGLTIFVVMYLRNQYKKAQMDKIVANQIEVEKKIWSEILKKKDINKAWSCIFSTI